MKKIVTLFALLLMFGIARVEAQTSLTLGPRLGYDIDKLNTHFIGAELRVTPAALPIVINPSVDYFFLDGDFKLIQGNANALYTFGIDNQLFTPYAGVGVALTRTSVVDYSQNDFGFNVIGGAVFGFGNLRPFVQTQITFGDTEQVTVAGGVLIRLGS